MSSRWSRSGASYELRWGGRDWTLSLDAARPGLISDADRPGPLLALDGVSSPDRDEPGALSGVSLDSHECRFDRVEALYIPEGWHSLRVRATWTPRSEDVLDLEVQFQANTVDELTAVQAHVRSACTTNLATAPTGPLLTIVDDTVAYLEFCHPDDSPGRVIDPTGSVRYALFGYDLERGVVLRGRLRGEWVSGRADAAEIARRYHHFLGEPLPLGR
jgi:hypothetical protein